jgi:hypothetical protein
MDNNFIQFYEYVLRRHCRIKCSEDNSIIAYVIEIVVCDQGHYGFESERVMADIPLAKDNSQ